MLPPLKSMTVTPNGAFGVKRVGSGLPDSQGVLRHIGVDLRASVGTPFYAPEDGTINERYIGTKNIKVLGLKGKYLHRFLHLEAFGVKLGQRVKAGQLLGYTGNSGDVAAHLHWDIRKLNTAWNDNFSNNFDPIKLIKKETEVINREMSIWLWRNVKMIHSPTEKQKVSLIGKRPTDVLKDWYDDADTVEHRRIVKNKYPEALKQIESLKAQVGDASKWQTLKTLLRELIK